MARASIVLAKLAPAQVWPLATVTEAQVMVVAKPVFSPDTPGLKKGWALNATDGPEMKQLRRLTVTLQPDFAGMTTGIAV